MKQPGKPNPNSDTPSNSSSLIVGAFALFASGIFGQALGLMTLIVTARLLTPTDFGVIAYFLITVSLLEIIQREVSMILIRLTDVSKDHLNTVFTIQLLLGVAAAALIWISTPLVQLVDSPELIELLPALCIIAIVTSIRSTRFPLLERNFQFWFAAGEDVISRITYTVFAIFLAWIWRDFWAIVVANFLTQIARIIWSFYAAPMMPKLSFKCWRDCFNFSSWSLGAMIAQFLTLSMPQIIIGATLGLADAGVYRIGIRFVSLFTRQAYAPLERVIYPKLANISRTDQNNQHAFEQANAILLGIIIPVSVGMALVSQDMVLVIAGYQWLAAAQVIWILAPLKAIETLQANVRSASYVGGNTKHLFVRNSILLIITFLFMLLGSQFEFLGALIASGVSSLAAILMTLIIAKQYSSRGLLGPLLTAWRTFLATGMMIVAVLIVSSAYGNFDAAGWAFDSPEDLPLLRIGTHLLLWHFAGRPEGFERSILKVFKKIYGHFSNTNTSKQDQMKS